MYRDSNHKIQPALLEKMRYIFMRLEFINPIYLPTLSESFLRRDFNFSQYLGLAYGKTLSGFFNTSWICLICIFIFAEIYRFLEFNINDWMLVLVNIIVPLAFIAIFSYFFFHFKNIAKVLYP
jgi:hypothetical protein